MKSIRVTTLDNGLRVATDQIDTVETASLGMWIAAGARHEAAEANGIAHLLEHMFFKGTERRSAYDISAEIETVGGHINAYTARENTAFYAKVLKEHVPLAIDVIADILQYSRFDPAELDRERDVVLQEIAQAKDTPDDIIFDYFQARAFPGQPLGRPVLGRGETVGSFTSDDLRSWRDKHYRGSGMVFAAAGNVDHDDIVGMVVEHFDAVPEGSAAEVLPATYEGGDTREARSLEQLHVVLGFEGVPIAAPDFYADSLMSNLLGGGMSSRLFQEIREKRGLAYSVYSFTSPFRDSGLFGVYAGTAGDQAAELIPALAGELTGLAASLTDNELEASRAQLKASLLMGLESTGARCEQLAQHLMLYGRALTIEEIVAGVEAVEPRQISALAARVFSGQPTFALLGPAGGVEAYDALAGRFAA
jgi:predicted Zn-dependent peptidase